MKRIELIGSPVTHVRSPAILNPMLQEAGEDVEVVAMELAHHNLADYARATRNRGDIIGLIVTMPLKEAILAHLNQATDLVRLVGASNCVRFDDGRWLGANFDGLGLVEALRSVDRPSNWRILLIGCGGAGSAIAASLVTIANVDLAIYDVDAQKTTRLAERLGAAGGGNARIRPAKPLGEFDIVINATPLGMHVTDPLPLPEETVARAEIVADIVAMETTPLKRLAVAMGKRLVSGEAMIVGQAALLHRFLLSRADSENQVLAAATGWPFKGLMG